jgi:hypothetical protein
LFFFLDFFDFFDIGSAPFRCVATEPTVPTMYPIALALAAQQILLSTSDLVNSFVFPELGTHSIEDHRWPKSLL